MGDSRVPPGARSAVVFGGMTSLVLPHLSQAVSLAETVRRRVPGTPVSVSQVSVTPDRWEVSAGPGALRGVHWDWPSDEVRARVAHLVSSAGAGVPL